MRSSKYALSVRREEGAYRLTLKESSPIHEISRNVCVYSVSVMEADRGNREATSAGSERNLALTIRARWMAGRAHSFFTSLFVCSLHAAFVSLSRALFLPPSELPVQCGAEPRRRCLPL